ncbi:MAG: hypothetical protein KGS72_16450 [Cyanobacteria bacterium REEB67]|nr:hypothetical protein [Cyanobacteria bacterium REEB67]
MGGDSRPDYKADSGTTPDATQRLIDQLNHKLTQDASGDTSGQRANYGGNLAPLTDNLGHATPGAGTDRYYHGGTGRQTRAGYGVSGTDAPGGAGEAPNKPGGNQPPDFRTLHQDQMRDPSKPYDRNTMGVPQQGQGGDQPGLPGRPTRTAGGPDDGTETRIQSLISSRGLYLSPYTPLGGAFGAIAAPYIAKGISMGADKALASTAEGSRVHSAAKYWQNNFDVSKMGKGDLVKTNTVPEANAKFANLVEAERKIASGGADEAAQAIAKERLDLLERPMTPSTVVDLKATNAARVSNGGKALFSDAEMAVIEGKYTSNVQLAAREDAIRKSLGATGSSTWKSMKAGAFGVMADIAAVNVDRYVAKQIGGTNSLIHSWNTEQILAPTALALSENLIGPGLLKKTGLVGATIVGSRIIDGATQAVGLGAPEKWNAPTGVMNWWDGFGVASGLAIAAATENPYAKAGAVAVGWAIPKVIHAFEDNSSNALAYRYDDLKSSFTTDHKDRSLSSLEKVTAASSNLDEKKEDWLVSKIAQVRDSMAKNWSQMSTEQKLLAFRDDAGMSRALGEDLLKNGTRIVKQGKPDYTLGGYEIDLGGRAMHYLVGAKDSTERAEEVTKSIIANNNDGSKPTILVDGSKPTQSEVDDLEKFKGGLQKDLAKILDQHHDIPAVINQVVKNIPSSSDDWRQTYIKPTDGLIEHYFPRNSPAQAAETAKILGKLYRDQAVAYLAFAQSIVDRGGNGDEGAALSLLVDNPNNHNDIFPSGRPKSYNGAEGVIKMARAFDPNSKDLADIQKAYDELLPKAEAQAKNQINGPQNILNVDGGNPNNNPR